MWVPGCPAAAQCCQPAASSAPWSDHLRLRCARLRRPWRARRRPAAPARPRGPPRPPAPRSSAPRPPPPDLLPAAASPAGPQDEDSDFKTELSRADESKLAALVDAASAAGGREAASAALARLAAEFAQLGVRGAGAAARGAGGRSIPTTPRARRGPRWRACLLPTRCLPACLSGDDGDAVEQLRRVHQAQAWRAPRQQQRRRAQVRGALAAPRCRPGRRAPPGALEPGSCVTLPGRWALRWRPPLHTAPRLALPAAAGPGSTRPRAPAPRSPRPRPRAPRAGSRPPSKTRSSARPAAARPLPVLPMLPVLPSPAPITAWTALHHPPARLRPGPVQLAPACRIRQASRRVRPPVGAAPTRRLHALQPACAAGRAGWQSGRLQHRCSPAVAAQSRGCRAPQAGCA